MGESRLGFLKGVAANILLGPEPGPVIITFPSMQPETEHEIDPSGKRKLPDFSGEYDPHGTRKILKNMTDKDHPASDLPMAPINRLLKGNGGEVTVWQAYQSTPAEWTVRKLLGLNNLTGIYEVGPRPIDGRFMLRTPLLASDVSPAAD